MKFCSHSKYNIVIDKVEPVLNKLCPSGNLLGEALQIGQAQIEVPTAHAHTHRQAVVQQTNLGQ